MRERLRKEYLRRVKMVLRTELYGRNKVEAINGLALPVLTYSFGVIHWGTTELQQLDRKTRRLLTMHGIHHPSADVDRLYVSRRDGGRGLMQIEGVYKSTIVGLDSYLDRSSDPFMKLVRESDSGKTQFSIKRLARQFTDQLQKPMMPGDTSESGVTQKDMSVGMFRERSHTRRVGSWRQKPMHGQYRLITEKPSIDAKRTFDWLRTSNLTGATEGLIVAAQDQAVRTRYYEKQILHQHISPTCRVCRVCPETVSHIVSGCGALAPRDYTVRHNQVASIIHWNICRHFGVPVVARWYRHQPDKLVETDDITMMWDTTIPTASKVKANRPDICLRHKKANTCLLIDISVPWDDNVGKAYADKLAKYADLRVEVNRMWHCQSRVIPVILGALGTVHAGMEGCLDSIPGHHNLQHLQSTALFGSARILRKHVSSV